MGMWKGVSPSAVTKWQRRIVSQQDSSPHVRTSTSTIQQQYDQHKGLNYASTTLMMIMMINWARSCVPKRCEHDITKKSHNITKRRLLCLLSYDWRTYHVTMYSKPIQMNIRLVKRSRREVSADRTKFIMKNQPLRAPTNINHLINARLLSLIILISFMKYI